MSHPSDSAFEERRADWLELSEAQSRILAAARPLPAEVVPCAAALGRALAAPLHATVTLPPWDNSAMDGYAALGADISGASADAPVRLKVVRAIHAGDQPGSPIVTGQATRIMTGAPVPPGADSVVRVEDTDAEREPGIVRILSDRDRGRSVRKAGQDMLEGDLLVEAGHVLSSRSIALLAAVGRTNIGVVARPTVAIVPTGDELRAPDRFQDVRDGRGVPESNTPMLAAGVTEAGGIAKPLGITPDDPAVLREKILAADDSDVLVTIGGASMGEADLVKRVLEEVGFELDFWRVQMRPGSPFSFGWLVRGDRRQPVFGLPGNPTSAFVTFELLVRPFLLALGGRTSVFRRSICCVAGEALRGPGDLAHFLRVALARQGGRTVARLSGPQGSGLMHPLAMADGLAVVPRGTDEIAEGESVEVVLLSGDAATQAASIR